MNTPGLDGVDSHVLNAIEQGFAEPKAIAIWLSLNSAQVGNAIKRLRHAGRIRRKNQGGYEPARNSTLMDTWK